MTPILLSISTSNRKNKKYKAVFLRGENIITSHFGDLRYQDFTTHKDSKRREKYLARTRNQDFTNPVKPSTLSRYLLWEYKDIHEAIAEYIRRFDLKK